MTANNHENAESYYNAGTEHYFAERYDEAIKALSKAIVLDPHNKLAYDRRGSAYKSLKHYDKALADYNAALEIDTSFENAYRNRAHVFRHNNLLAAAIADFKRAKIYSSDDKAHNMIDKLIEELEKKLNAAQ